MKTKGLFIILLFPLHSLHVIAKEYFNPINSFGNPYFNLPVEIFGSDLEKNNSFGTPVSIFGNRVLISAFSDDYLNNDARGAVYVFEFDGTNWIEVDKIIPSDSSFQDRFGQSISLKGNRALIGALRSAYVFEYENDKWVEKVKLLSPDYNDISVRFGWNVALDGNRAVISDSNGGPGRNGSVHMYEFDGAQWNNTTNFNRSHPGSHLNSYGASVALKGNRLMVSDTGARHVDLNIVAGAVYVYEFDGLNWNNATIFSGDGISNITLFGEKFGSGISMYGDSVLIGATLATNSNQETTGVVYEYIFDGVEWIQSKKFWPSDEVRNFGRSISLFRDVAILGKSGSNEVTVFRKNIMGWDNGSTIQPDAIIDGDAFGSAVASDGNHLVVGASGRTPSDGSNLNSGTVFIYTSDQIFTDGFDTVLN